MEDSIFKYDRSGRLLYHPELHENHGKTWSLDELEYLCKFHHAGELNDMSLALGRPATSITTKITYLRKQGQYDFYRKLNRYYVEVI